MPDDRSPSNEDSQDALQRAKTVMPVDGSPLFVKEAEGCRITDVDGNAYIDYVSGSGSIIVGHADERVVSALSKAIGRGTNLGAPVETEAQLASVILSALPAMEMLRFTDSRDDAMNGAFRLARAATGRELLLCPGMSPFPNGVISIPYNDLGAAKSAFEKHRGKIACVALEPVATRAGVIAPAPGYLVGLRELCDTHGALLLFDESITGFRVGWGGAQLLFHVTPDITCLASVIGGGLPLAACAASRKLMETQTPLVLGTGGNPVALAGGIATLEILKEPGTYETLEERGAMLAKGLAAAAENNGVSIVLNRVGSMMSISFGEARDRYVAFFNAMLAGGVFLPANQLDPWFVSLAHTEDAISKTIDAGDAAFKAIRDRIAPYGHAQ